MNKRENKKKHGISKLESTVGDFEVFDYWAEEKEKGNDADNYKKGKVYFIDPDGYRIGADTEKDVEDYVKKLEVRKTEQDNMVQ